MNSTLFSIPAFVNRVHCMDTLLDDGCMSYGLITQKAVKRAGLPRVRLPKPVASSSFEGCSGSITEAAVIDQLDVGGSLQKQAQVFLYVVPRIQDYDMILGRPWRQHELAYINPATDVLHIRRTGVKVQNLEKSQAEEQRNAQLVSASSFSCITANRESYVFKVTMADIEKTLQKLDQKKAPPTKAQLRALIPKEYHQNLDVFDKTLADQMPPFRPGLDHKIELLRDERGKEKEPPWGPLYPMSREQLLVLRKTLTEQLDKGYIRVSHSPAAAPVLFVRKPGGGLRFCVDYRALNDITRKDRYPLPLIKETLHQIGKAKYFTKLDVIAAFNKVRVAEGDEWKTAFRTRYGLFEYLVTPFGLANAPSTFQRYINHALREYLDLFVSAYVDDILIYTEGSLRKHQRHVKQVLQKLQDAGLFVDIDKCEFNTQSTKYLGYIIEAGQGIRMDPAKIQVIKDWEKPTSVRGVRSFLGFANFYHAFIEGFAELVHPLNALTTKKAIAKPFSMTPEASAAFTALKSAFLSAPAIAYFDPDRKTVLETDASGWCSGGVLKQLGPDGEKPVAFYSKKHAPAECNYEIHDKELLAIVRCLEEWNEFLIAVPEFVIRTDHKNLQYFNKIRQLTERQMRWSLLLSKFNFVLEYKPGRLNSMADALSRRDQDTPQDNQDNRVAARGHRIFRDERFLPSRVQISPVSINTVPLVDGDLTELWQAHETTDATIRDLKDAVIQNFRQIPAHLRHLSVSMSDLAIYQDKLTFRHRYWVPDHEQLRTGLIQQHHDACTTGHPGKNNLVAIMSRAFHWPGMTKQISQFVRNCRACGRNVVWRTRKQGLLQPLPVPSRPWQEISMDYITGLPLTPNGHRHILVIVDRLSKGMIAVPCKDLEGATLAQKMWEHYMPHHGLPAAITSDRGEQFVHGIWGHMARLYGIKKRLSTAYHPETDGQTERTNQTIEELLRLHCSYHQTDWDSWLPAAQLAVLHRDASTTKMSPFFMMHGYHPELGLGIDLPDLTEDAAPTNPVDAASRKIHKMQDAIEFATASLSYAQQQQELAANRHRNVAPAYRVGDKVWLDLRNIRVENPRKKKLCELYGIFTIIEVISNKSYRLDVPEGIHNVFNTMLLRPVEDNPLPSQSIDETQPAPILVDDEEEYEVENIVNHRLRKRQGQQILQFLVKWKGYAAPSWTNSWNCASCSALTRYEERIGKHFSAEELGVDDA